MMLQLNADDDEREFVSKCLDDAIAYSHLYRNIPEKERVAEDNEDITSVEERNILQMATTFYSNRDGTAKPAYNNPASLNMMANYIRRPNI